MIISRTPLRISFVGDGTDIANFYRHENRCDRRHIYHGDF